LCLSLGLRLFPRLSLGGKGFIDWLGGRLSLYLSTLRLLLRLLLRLSLGGCPGTGFIDWLRTATTHLAKSEIFGPECRRNSEIGGHEEEGWHRRRWHLTAVKSKRPDSRHKGCYPLGF